MDGWMDMSHKQLMDEGGGSDRLKHGSRHGCLGSEGFFCHLRGWIDSTQSTCWADDHTLHSLRARGVEANNVRSLVAVGVFRKLFIIFRGAVSHTAGTECPHLFLFAMHLPSVHSMMHPSEATCAQ